MLAPIPALAPVERPDFEEDVALGVGVMEFVSVGVLSAGKFEAVPVGAFVTLGVYRKAVSRNFPIFRPSLSICSETTRTKRKEKGSNSPAHSKTAHHQSYPTP